VCFLTKYIHFAETRILQTSFRKWWFCIPCIHSSFTYICNMYKFIRYATLSSSSKICCMTKGAKTFTAMDSHFVDHMKTSPHAIFLSPRIYIPWIERNGCVLLCGCKQSFGCNMFTLIGYSFFGKTRRYFFTAAFSFCGNYVFSFLDVLQYIGTTSMPFWKLWVSNGAQHFSHLLIFL
jgi:hypothetical protein